MPKTEFPCPQCGDKGMLRASRSPFSRNIYRPCGTCQPVALRHFLKLYAKGAPEYVVREMLGSPIPQRYVVMKKAGAQIVFDRKENTPVTDIPNTSSEAAHLARILNLKEAFGELSPVT